MRRISLLTFIFVSLAACPEAEIEKEIALENVESLQRGISDPKSPDWSNVPNDDVVIAEVNGVPLSKKNLEHQMKAQPGVSASSLLDRMIEMEALAQIAAKEEHGLTGNVLAIRKRAMARAYLREVFETEVTSESYPMENVKEDYRLNKHIFWHDHDEIRAVQLMETCCDAGEGKGGCTTAEDLACFVEAAPRMALYEQELRERFKTTVRTPKAIKKLLADYRTEIDRANPNLRYEEIAKPIKFVVGMPQEWHRGRYDIFAREVVEELFSIDNLELSRPVQSSFGWHILVKLEHHEARHWKEDDPRVAEEIRGRRFPYFQREVFKHRLTGLKSRYSVEYNDSGLQILDELSGAPQKQP
jgi:hypothetical protein